MRQILILCFSMWMVLGSSVAAAELIMFEQKYCEYCDLWEDEVGGIYHKTPEGKRAPLRRVDIHETLPEDIAHIPTGRFTPTFVLIEGGVEIGRIRGYGGNDFFWGLLGQMLDKLPGTKAVDG
ncbi:MAG: transcriptional regulator [Ahrensia sp.]|nr:transcriptional regulator [Ahrensia sp.]